MKTNAFTGLALAALMLAGCGSATSQTPDAPTSTQPTTDDVVTQLMMSRRSIRSYKDSAISRQTLDDILTCGVNAPNGRNMQAYEIRVLSPAMIDSLTAAVVRDNPKIAERKGFKNIFVNAPCVICIANDTHYDMSQIDCGLLGENIILSAWAKGIGSCCLGSSARWIIDSPSARPFLKKMEFSEGYQLLYCIALGYPDETPEAKPRTMDKIRYIE
ncbi:MAG: nitroreductase family protein [Alloprevotella sp.]|nr:nitroreductase family protein [Alloprevotella sp.]